MAIASEDEAVHIRLVAVHALVPVLVRHDRVRLLRCQANVVGAVCALVNPHLLIEVRENSGRPGFVLADRISVSGKSAAFNLGQTLKTHARDVFALPFNQAKCRRNELFGVRLI